MNYSKLNDLILSELEKNSSIPNPKKTAKFLLDDLFWIHGISNPKTNAPLDKDIVNLALRWAHGHSDGKPLAYVTGLSHFYGRRFFCNPSTLIPRPETERLVETLLERCPNAKKGIEIGVGTGAISLTLLSENPDLILSGSDISNEILDLCRKNKKALGISDERLSLFLAKDNTDVFAPFDHIENDSFDFICSNPPYISPSDPISEDVLMWEPASALYAPKKTDYFYEKIALEGQKFLKKEGIACLEINSLRKKEITELFLKNQWHCEIVNDYNEYPRILIAWI